MKQKQKIREQFKTEVFNRDNHKCKMCDHKENLDAHHITDRNKMPNGGYVMENGISLCPKCHEKAEIFHQSDGRDWPSRFHPINLYQKIESDYHTAFNKSLILLDE